MTVVISNTSPLTNLAAIGQFDVLRALYGGFADRRGGLGGAERRWSCWPGCHEVAGADWIARRGVTIIP